MIILVDQDGVLADCEGEFIRRIRKEFPDMPIIPNEERNTFYLEDQYTELPEGIVYEWMGEEHFFRNLEPMPGAIEGLQRLIDEQHEIFICTTPIRSPYCIKEKIEWIYHYFPDLKDRVITAKDKTLIVGDVLIDDKPEIKGLNDAPAWVHLPYRSGARNSGTFDWENMEPLYKLMARYDKDWMNEW